MVKKTLGRPTNDKLVLTKDDILKEALNILDTQGVNELSFRKLAKVFGVTAMALKHHIGSRQDLIQSLVDIVYKHVNDITDTENPKEAIRNLLGNYCKIVIKHPNLTRILLADHSLINKDLTVLIMLVRKQASILIEDENEAVLFADIIVDYTHGFAIAAASQNEKTTAGVITIDDFYKGLDWLLAKS